MTLLGLGHGAAAVACADRPEYSPRLLRNYTAMRLVIIQSWTFYSTLPFVRALPNARIKGESGRVPPAPNPLALPSEITRVSPTLGD